MLNKQPTCWLAVVMPLILIASSTVVGAAADRGEQRLKSNPGNIKNVLFLVSDDLKASVLGCYGDPMCKTPNLDRLAKQGVLFRRAYCQAMWCAPSRQSFMFSRYQGTGPVNLGQAFRENGWYTARVGKIYHMRVPGDIIAGTNGNDVAASWTERFNSPGLEAHTPGDYACLNLNVFTTELANRESTKMKHRMFVTVQYDGDGSDQADHKSASKAIELLNQHQNEPFFLAVGLVRPHYPMVAPRNFFEPYPWQSIPLPIVPAGDLDDIPQPGLAGTRSDKNEIGNYPNNQKKMWQGYYASTAFMDAQVGRILDELDRLGLRDTTAVVFCSDHGYHLGEHLFWQKSNLHEEVTRVPLIISAPGFQPGITDSLVELVDMFPTLCELSGLEIPDSVQGKSLVPILKNPLAKVRDSAFYAHNGTGIRTNQWAYMRYNDDSRELYDMQADPKQFTNLATRTEYQSVVKELDATLSKRMSDADWNQAKRRK